MKKRLFSLVLAVALLFSNVNCVFAAEGTTVKTSMSDKLEWLDAEIAELDAKIEAAKANGEEAIAELEEQVANAQDAVTTLKSSVTNIKVTNNKTKVKVTWSGVKSADRYQVVLYRNGKRYSTKYTSNLAYSWSNQARGVYYKVKVTPYAKYEGKNYYGISKTSKAKYVKLGYTTPTLTVKKSGNYQKLTAGDMNSTGYQVKIAKNSKFTKGVKTYKFKTSYGSLNKSLKTSKYFSNGRKYVKVRPYTTINGKTYYGKWSKVKTKK